MGQNRSNDPASEPDTVQRDSGFRRLLAACGVLASCVFLLNLSFGLIEIPDNLPFIGNVDEVVATGFLLACLRYLGLDVLPFSRRVERKKSSEQGG